jgi:hypothetical protein
VNQNEEEFDMELASEYSEQEEEDLEPHDSDFDDEDDFDEEEQEATAGGGAGGKKKMKKISKAIIKAAKREHRQEEQHFLSLTYKEKLEYGDPILQAQRLREEKLYQQQLQQQTAMDIILKYPKLVQILLKVRLKLIAIAMFQSLRLRGCSDLMAIRVASCGLTERIVPTLAMCLMENTLIRDLTIAHNTEILSSIASCKYLSDILEHGNLTALDITNTGLREGGLMMIAKAMEKSKQLRRIDFSENRLGPTAANMVANLHKQYYADVIRITPGHFKSAPDLFAASSVSTGNPNNAFMDWNDDDELNPVEALKRRKRKNRRAWLANSMRRSKGNQQSDESESDASSFVDTDLFDGEEDNESTADDDSVSAISKGMELL